MAWHDGSMDKPTNLQVAVAAIVLTLLIEAITVLGRFAFGLAATRDTASWARFTLGLRILHAYIGVVLAAFALATLHRWPAFSRWTLAVGLALIASDLIHHFLVLWPVTGSPQFDLVYPAPTSS